MRLNVLFVGLSLVFFCALAQSQAPAKFPIGGLFEFTLTDVETGQRTEAPTNIKSIYSGFRLAIDDINNNPNLLPNTELVPVVFDTEGTVSGALAGLVEANEKGLNVIVGPTYSEQSLIAAVAAGVYDILLASPSASADSLKSSMLYPLFIRAVPPDTQQSEIMVDLVEYYYNQTGISQWRNVSVISTADDYGVGGAKAFIDRAALINITTVAFQQFLVGATDVTVEVRELSNSGGRVFIAFMHAADYQTMIQEANERDIVGKYYVWICSDGCATSTAFEDPTTGRQIRRFAQLSVGYQGTLPQSGTGDLYDAYLRRWLSLDPNEFPGAGEEPTLFSLLAYEITTAVAYTIQDQFLNGNSSTGTKGNFLPTGSSLYKSIGAVNFVGITGPFSFEPNGDRRAFFEVVNLLPNYEYQRTFTWDKTNGLQSVKPTVWHSGTTVIPDLSVLEEFDYWSCHDKEDGTDDTGKTIKLRRPDSDDVNYIRASYECDQFIDCQNMSDEGYQCTPSFTLAFVLVGILTGILVLGSIWCIPFVCVFGFCVRRHRIFLSGTLFLVIMLISCVIGFISTYTVYGKPHTVACNFELWLFGLTSCSLAAALFAKQLRFFRATAGTNFFRMITKSDQKGPSNPINPEIEFLILWFLLMLFPLLIIILWTAVSTPTAQMEDIDGDDHYVCESGGATGYPGGLVWFFILVAYNGVEIFLCLLLGFFVRHVPKPFMDKRLMSISVFNLGFLTAVVVPVFLVLRYISPFAAWMVRTLGILYGFASTLLIHMIPKLVGLTIIDRFQPNAGDGKTGPSVRPGTATADTSSMSASQSNG